MVALYISKKAKELLSIPVFDISYEVIDDEIDIEEEIKKNTNIRIEHIIIELSVCTSDILRALRKYKITGDDAHIVILLPDNMQPDNTTAGLVRMGVYDFIEVNDFIVNNYRKAMSSPAKYKSAVRWDTAAADISLTENTVSGPKGKEKTKTIIIEKSSEAAKPTIVKDTVTIIKEKIIGKVYFCMTGLYAGAGVTHISIATAKALKSVGLEAAVYVTNPASWANLCFVFNNKEDAAVMNINDMFYYRNDYNPFDIPQKYVIMDCGVFTQCDNTLYNMAAVRCLIVTDREWHDKELFDIVQHHSPDDLKQLCFIINHCDNVDDFDVIKNNLVGINAVPFPSTTNPLCHYVDNHVALDAIRHISGQYIPSDLIPRLTHNGSAGPLKRLMRGLKHNIVSFTIIALLIALFIWFINSSLYHSLINN
jgi:hypothetical protein